MTDVQAITLDFGNTLVPFPAGPMAEVVQTTAQWAAERIGCSAAEFTVVWGEERLRQFVEDVPEGREADMDIRGARVLARLRGRPAPADGERWDDAAAAADSEPHEIESALSTYAEAFVRLTPVPPAIGPMLERLSREYRLAILSNWPLDLAVERFLEAAGWRRYFPAGVVSQRVGVIKPWPTMAWAENLRDGGRRAGRRLRTRDSSRRRRSWRGRGGCP